MKIFVPDEAKVLDAARQRKESKLNLPVRKKHPRCACGCGRAAYWPHGAAPVFHTRLCGYEMALRIVEQERKESEA